jgi:prevent-host-death family protein
MKMTHVQVRPVRDLRNHYSEIETLLQDHQPVVITKNGRGAAALINFEDYSKFEDYQYDKYVAQRLAEAEKEAASPQADWQDAHGMIARLREKYHAV